MTASNLQLNFMANGAQSVTCISERHGLPMRLTPMLRLFVRVVGATVILFCVRLHSQGAPSSQPAGPSFGFKMAVDEVSLTLSAVDSHGLAVNDLRADELRLLDNGKPPRKILAFDAMQDFPIRAGILLDTSESMEAHVRADRAIATQFAVHVLRQQTDEAFVMDFGYVSKIEQAWTSSSAALSTAVGNVSAEKQNPLSGTALFDTVFRACFHEFGKLDPKASGNFVLLFTDGEDNKSHTSLDEAVDICQKSNTAIYIFRAEPASSMSSGPKNLAELARETGGRVFRDDESDATLIDDLKTIEANLRNQYRLVYRPEEIRRDGSFHQIVVLGPERVANITVRSGYYAPKQ
jgi:Ca-activated chloride channel family protein